MTQEEIENLKRDAEGVNIGTYVAKGAVNIQKIEHVENLFPGAIDKLHNIIKNDSRRVKLLNDDELRDVINRILPKIKKNRHWFCVIKPLMLYGQIKNKDFEGAKERIDGLYPAGLEPAIDASDLQAMHNGTFEGPINDWKVGDGPFLRDAEFRLYWNLAKEFERILKEALAPTS